MKRVCKNVKLNAAFIEEAILKCLEHKWTRGDVARYLSKHSDKSEKEIRDLTICHYKKGVGYIHHRSELAPEIKSIAAVMEKEISRRDIRLQEIKYRERYDTSSHKWRTIGIESIKQQFYDYVLVEALKELFDKKIGDNQFACVPGRGQKHGKERIEKWIRTQPKKCKYVGKGDIKKCYPSIPEDRLLAYLHKWVKNDDILYMAETIVSTYDSGLSIGSYASTWLCNLYLSQLYHYANERLFKLRKTSSGKKRVRLIHKIAFYMDDVVVFGPRKANVLSAMRKINAFLKNELDLTLKDSWTVYALDGDNVDIMGYKIAKTKTTVRSKTFVKIRRTFAKAERALRTSGDIPLPLARRCVSYNGIIGNADAYKFMKKYKRTLAEAKEKISNESKVHRKAAGG